VKRKNRVPLTLGVGGDVIGSATVDIEGGEATITGYDIEPEVSAKLFGAYSAGDFSIAKVRPKLCYFCGADKCRFEDTDAYFDTCPCCVDGHVI
jgi:hypothetical protein